MPEFQIPYHTSVRTFKIPEENFCGVLNARIHEFIPDKDEKEIVQAALDNPIDSPPLCQLAKNKNRVVIVTSDHTRSVPSKITMPLLLKEVRKGNPHADITILVGTGLHRPSTVEEQKQMFGDEIVRNEKIAINNAFDPASFVRVCKLPSGADFEVNKLAKECDLLIAEGFIEPHFFAGFSGGRKSILPGICSEATVNENHCFNAIASPYATAGVLEDNPIHKDMVFAARKMNTAFILNVALNAEKKIIAAFAGDLEKAHEEGCKFVRELSECDPIEGDIVITSNGGYPLDQNLYQSPKAGSTAAACAGEDGVIILCIGCVDGIGGEHFEKLMSYPSLEEMEQYLASLPPEKTIPEQWCAQIYARILKNHPVIICSDMVDPGIINTVHMSSAKTPEEAMQLAFKLKGKEARVVVIPDGVSPIIASK